MSQICSLKNHGRRCDRGPRNRKNNLLNIRAFMLLIRKSPFLPNEAKSLERTLSYLATIRYSKSGKLLF
jgi:hypothetical protein